MNEKKTPAKPVLRVSGVHWVCSGAYVQAKSKTPKKAYEAWFRAVVRRIVSLERQSSSQTDYALRLQDKIGEWQEHHKKLFLSD